MNRKNFLTGLLGSLPAVALSAPLPFVRAHSSNNQVVKSPPYLKPGDCIGIVSPAGFIDKEALEPSLQQLAVWGFTTRIGSSIGKRDFTFGGTDEERLHDLQKMLDDPTIKAILCARGGYGVVRIVDRID